MYRFVLLIIPPPGWEQQEGEGGDNPHLRDQPLVTAVAELKYTRLQKYTSDKGQFLEGEGGE